jgi:hypothetical protein
MYFIYLIEVDLDGRLGEDREASSKTSELAIIPLIIQFKIS